MSNETDLWPELTPEEWETATAIERALGRRIPICEHGGYDGFCTFCDAEEHRVIIDEIEPALTPDEWAKRESGRPCYHSKVGETTFAVQRDGGLWISDDAVATQVFTEDQYALIALANAALPDKDPRKITHSRLDSLRAVVEAGTPYSEHRATERAIAEAGQMLAALAALLPPE